MKVHSPIGLKERRSIERLCVNRAVVRLSELPL
jgi:hypothetical protein